MHIPLTEAKGTAINGTVNGVVVELEGLPYREGDVLTIVVGNGLGQAIWTTDWQTACSIVTLQRWTGKVWNSLLGCTLGRPPLPKQIEPGRSAVILIDPRSPHLGRLMLKAGSQLAFERGWYRITFTYRLSPFPLNGSSAVVYSDVFRVSPNPGGSSRF